MKSSALDPYKYPYLVKFPLLKLPYFSSHKSQFSKHLSFMTLKGDTFLQIQ